MYGSEITRRNRAETVYINSVLKKQEFESGKSIRIERQKGGTDYEFLVNVDLGNRINLTYDTYFPLSIKSGANPTIFAVYNLSQVDFSGRDGSANYIINERGTPLTDPSTGNPYTFNGLRIIDDGFIQIPTGSRDFYFFGTNYGGNNNIFWYTNNALTFGSSTSRVPSISKDFLPSILLGNYDRICSSLYYSSYFTQDTLFSVIVIIVYFSDYYTDTSNFAQGKYQIRLIRELKGNNRQWVEVTVISSVPSPGYSNNASVNYPSGTDASGNRIDSDGNRIDPTKNSPYDITNGTAFQNVIGSTFSTVSPQTGTSFLYQSDPLGNTWTFINNAYVPV
jgi:hypothetical protein